METTIAQQVDGTILSQSQLRSLGGKWNEPRLTWEFEDGSFGRLENLANAYGLVFCSGREL
jgi:hypothetical protein